jgi:hypothetical protein
VVGELQALLHFLRLPNGWKNANVAAMCVGFMAVINHAFHLSFC